MAPMPHVYTYYYYLQEHLPVDTISIAIRNFFFQLFLFDNGIKVVLSLSLRPLVPPP